MAVKMKDFGLENLSLDERLALVQEIWDSISMGAEHPPVTDEQKRLLDQRIAELDANPSNVLTWDQAKHHFEGDL